MDSKAKDNKTVTIEIQKYHPIVQILNNPRSILRIFLFVFVITVALFGGISLVLVSLKRMYPYNDIVTNAMGATTIRNEEKEVSYWLFNTATLWADSGIKVKEGQYITVRASGKKHTAVHHLVEDTYKNRPLREPWVGSEGFIVDPRANGARDTYRAKYRIYPEQPQDALLMRVLPTGKTSDDFSDRPKDNHNKPQYEEPQYEFIGKEREQIYIRQDGTLQFAINDIVLDKKTIIRIMIDLANGKYMVASDSLVDAFEKKHLSKTTYEDFVCAFSEDTAKFKAQWTKDDLSKKEADSTGIKPQPKNPESNDSKYTNPFKFGCGYGDQKDQIELFGYYVHGYKQAWFEDNIGSFLIIVETYNAI